MFFADLGLVLWLVQPIIYANMLPVIVGKHGHPIDGNRRLGDGQPLFGPGKTWEGLLFGPALATIGAMVVIFVAYAVGWTGGVRIWLGGHRSITWHIATLAAGALIGDLLKSFLKRRLGKGSGQSWPVFDQVDALIGGWLAIALVDPVWFRQAWLSRWSAVLTLVPAYLLLHRGLSRWAHRRGWKSHPH